MIAKNLHVTGYDNRGDDETAYGFVYFSDDCRVAYSTTTGVTTGTGGWDPITAAHVKLATEHLRKAGVPLKENAS